MPAAPEAGTGFVLVDPPRTDLGALRNGALVAAIAHTDEKEECLLLRQLMQPDILMTNRPGGNYILRADSNEHGIELEIVGAAVMWGTCAEAMPAEMMNGAAPAPPDGLRGGRGGERGARAAGGP
jgi:hypothetical protein